MQTNEIINHLHKRFSKLEGRYHDVVERFDVDAIHDFRVEIKKLRAVLRLMSASHSHHQLKIPGDIKDFYTSIGIVRNLQLHQLRMQKMWADSVNKPSQYLEYLHFEEEMQKKRAKELSRTISIAVLQEKVLKTGPTMFTKESPQVFVSQKHTRLQQLVMAPLAGDEELHDIRKTVKDLLYTWKYIEPDAVAILPVPLTSADKMDALSGSLGDFCDLCVALSLLEVVHTGSVTIEPEKQLLLAVSQQLNEEKLQMKERLWEGLMLLRTSESSASPAPGAQHPA